MAFMPQYSVLHHNKFVHCVYWHISKVKQSERLQNRQEISHYAFIAISDYFIRSNSLTTKSETMRNML
jgi:hypothetical protein